MIVCLRAFYISLVKIWRRDTGFKWLRTVKLNIALALALLKHGLHWNLSGIKLGLFFPGIGLFAYLLSYFCPGTEISRKE